MRGPARTCQRNRSCSCHSTPFGRMRCMIKLAGPAAGNTLRNHCGTMSKSTIDEVLPNCCRTVLRRRLLLRWRVTQIRHLHKARTFGSWRHSLNTPHPPHAWKVQAGCEVQPAPGNGLLYLTGACVRDLTRTCQLDILRWYHSTPFVVIGCSLHIAGSAAS